MINKKQYSDLIRRKIKNNGFRLTSTREAILDTITSSKSSLTAEEIFIKVHKKAKKTGIATVYRTISLLEQFQLIYRDNKAGKKARYTCLKNSDLNSVGNLKKETIHPTVKSVKKNNAPESIFENKNRNLVEIDKISRIQNQMNEWNAQLNKIKSEKELDLEEIINDFGKLDKVLARHEYSKNNLIQMLIDFQTEYNWLPKHVLFYVGKKIEVPLSQVYSIASFYKFFNLEPKGKYQVVVCEGTACHVRGSASLLQRIVNILNVKPGCTTPDYRFTLDTVNCLGCCALGPVMLYNTKYYSNPSLKQLEKLFDAAI